MSCSELIESIELISYTCVGTVSRPNCVVWYFVKFCYKCKPVCMMIGAFSGGKMLKCLSLSSVLQVNMLCLGREYVICVLNVCSSPHCGKACNCDTYCELCLVHQGPFS